MAYNNRMQPDQVTRYASILAADARRYVERLKMYNLVVYLSSLIVLSGCVSVEKQRSNIESNISEIYSSHFNKEIQQFYTEEAVSAGVKTIRAMKPYEKAPLTYRDDIVRCGFVDLWSKAVIIEVNEPRCLSLYHLAHEIAHIGSKCIGHNDVFYKYSIALVKRYEKKFPNAATRKWFAPVQDVTHFSTMLRDEHC